MNSRLSARLTPRHILMPALALLLLAFLPARPCPAQPQPGDIFREYTFNYGKTKSAHFSELDPDCPRKKDPNFGMRTMKPHVPKTIAGLDLEGAVRAELSVEYWGGHIGTTGQRFRVNGHDWIDIPQPAGTPGNPYIYHRTMLGNNAVAIPLEQLRPGQNTVAFAAGPQVKEYSFNWGFYWIYDFTIRVYYNASKPHPAGRVTSPKPGAVLGDKPIISAEVGGGAAGVKQVDFIGFYNDFDWAGNGKFRQWHWQTIHGVMDRHIGTAAKSPYEVTWQNEWVPDQDEPMQIAAKITAANGISFITPAVEGLKLTRADRSVKMFAASDVPPAFQVRVDKKKSCTIAVPDSLAGARAARLVVSTWSGSTDDESAIHEICLNGERIANRFGAFHNYSFDALEVPVSLIKQGDNTVLTHSNYQHHALEVNWPGPALLVEFKRPTP